MLAQDIRSVLKEKNILNHMDVGVNVGTMGIGIDVAMPVGDYVRIRAGYNYMPRFTLHSDFNIETSGGGKASAFINKFGKINEILSGSPIDLDWSDFKTEKELMQAYENGSFKAKDQVTMNLKPNLHQFKFLVDVFPFKNNKHWSCTAGFFVGPSKVGEACNQESETALLKAVNLYNERYYKKYVKDNFQFFYVDGDGNSQNMGEINNLTNFVKKNGMAGFCLGYFADGQKAMMVPGKNNTVCATMEVSKFRPYIGLGYNTHLSRDHKWNLNVDAGVLLLCGKPKVLVDGVYKIETSKLKGSLDEYGGFVYESGIGYVKEPGFKPDNWESDEEFVYQYKDEYYGDIVRFFYDPTHSPNTWYDDRPGVRVLNNVDLARDLHDIPGKVGDMVNTISKFKVYPNLSVTFSYRLF